MYSRSLSPLSTELTSPTPLSPTQCLLRSLSSDQAAATTLPLPPQTSLANRLFRYLIDQKVLGQKGEWLPNDLIGFIQLGDLQRRNLTQLFTREITIRPSDNSQEIRFVLIDLLQLLSQEFPNAYLVGSGLDHTLGPSFYPRFLKDCNVDDANCKEFEQLPQEPVKDIDIRFLLPSRASANDLKNFQAIINNFFKRQLYTQRKMSPNAEELKACYKTWKLNLSNENKYAACSFGEDCNIDISIEIGNNPYLFFSDGLIIYVGESLQNRLAYPRLFSAHSTLPLPLALCHRALKLLDRPKNIPINNMIWPTFVSKISKGWQPISNDLNNLILQPIQTMDIRLFLTLFRRILQCKHQDDPLAPLVWMFNGCTLLGNVLPWIDRKSLFQEAFSECDKTPRPKHCPHFLEAIGELICEKEIPFSLIQPLIQLQALFQLAHGIDSPAFSPRFPHHFHEIGMQEGFMVECSLQDKKFFLLFPDSPEQCLAKLLHGVKNLNEKQVKALKTFHTHFFQFGKRCHPPQPKLFDSYLQHREGAAALSSLFPPLSLWLLSGLCLETPNLSNLHALLETLPYLLREPHEAFQEILKQTFARYDQNFDAIMASLSSPFSLKKYAEALFHSQDNAISRISLRLLSKTPEQRDFALDLIFKCSLENPPKAWESFFYLPVKEIALQTSAYFFEKIVNMIKAKEVVIHLGWNLAPARDYLETLLQAIPCPIQRSTLNWLISDWPIRNDTADLADKAQLNCLQSIHRSIEQQTLTLQEVEQLAPLLQMLVTKGEDHPQIIAFKDIFYALIESESPNCRYWHQEIALNLLEQPLLFNLLFKDPDALLKRLLAIQEPQQKKRSAQEKENRIKGWISTCKLLSLLPFERLDKPLFLQAIGRLLEKGLELHSQLAAKDQGRLLIAYQEVLQPAIQGAIFFQAYSEAAGLIRFFHRLKLIFPPLQISLEEFLLPFVQKLNPQLAVQAEEILVSHYLASNPLTPETMLQLAEGHLIHTSLARSFFWITHWCEKRATSRTEQEARKCQTLIEMLFHRFSDLKNWESCLQLLQMQEQYALLPPEELGPVFVRAAKTLLTHSPATAAKVYLQYPKAFEEAASDISDCILNLFEKGNEEELQTGLNLIGRLPHQRDLRVEKLIESAAASKNKHALPQLFEKCFSHSADQSLIPHWLSALLFFKKNKTFPSNLLPLLDEKQFEASVFGRGEDKQKNAAEKELFDLALILQKQTLQEALWQPIFRAKNRLGTLSFQQSLSYAHLLFAHPSNGYVSQAVEELEKLFEEDVQPQKKELFRLLMTALNQLEAIPLDKIKKLLSFLTYYLSEQYEILQIADPLLKRSKVLVESFLLDCLNSKNADFCKKQGLQILDFTRKEHLVNVSLHYLENESLQKQLTSKHRAPQAAAIALQAIKESPEDLIKRSLSLFTKSLGIIPIKDQEKLFDQVMTALFDRMEELPEIEMPCLDYLFTQLFSFLTNQAVTDAANSKRYWALFFKSVELFIHAPVKQSPWGRFRLLYIWQQLMVMIANYSGDLAPCRKLIFDYAFSPLCCQDEIEDYKNYYSRLSILCREALIKHVFREDPPRMLQISLAHSLWPTPLAISRQHESEAAYQAILNLTKCSAPFLLRPAFLLLKQFQSTMTATQLEAAYKAIFTAAQDRPDIEWQFPLMEDSLQPTSQKFLYELLYELYYVSPANLYSFGNWPAIRPQVLKGLIQLTERAPKCTRRENLLKKLKESLS